MSNNKVSTEELERKIQFLENELRNKCNEVDELKSSFLGNISHEVRTPMNAIMGFSSLLQDTDISEEDRSLFVDGILKSSKSLLAVIDNIMEASKLQTNKVRPIIRKFEVYDLLLELYHNYKRQVDSEVKLRVNCTPDNITMSSDPQLLRSIISKLLENAIKFTEKGFIEVGCQMYSDNMVEFYVQDTGIGIEEKNKKEIYDHFNQIEKSRSKKHTGLGIGLNLARQLTELLDGEIKMDSQPGSGTTFTLVMPLKIQTKENDYRNKLVEKDILIEEIYSRKKSLPAKKIEREFSVRSKYSNYRA